MNDRLMNVQAVADYLGVSKARVYETWRAWGLPFFKVGQHLRMRRIDLEVWVEEKAALSRVFEENEQEGTNK